MKTPRILQSTLRNLLAAVALFAFAGASLAQTDLPTGPAPKGKPSEPGWGFWTAAPTAWFPTHKGNVDQAKKGGINVVFLGDSITKGWSGAGKEIWEATYKPLGAANFGIGADSTRQVLWRIENGTVDGITPKVVVLMIGTNNLYADNNSGTNEEIAQGIEEIVKRLRVKLPATKVIVIGILPRENGKFAARIDAINAIAAKLDDGKSVRFLDLTSKFQEPNGTVKADLYTKDLVHLQKPGYEVISASLLPLVEELSK